MNVSNNDMINTEKLISQIPRYFNNDINTIISELIQNSTRAGASFIKLDYRKDHDYLIIVDDGKGIDDIIESITIANSVWDNSIMENQDPAGVGIFSTFSISYKVEISSKFGTLIIDPELFFSSRDYRLRLKDSIDIDNIYEEGTMIVLSLKDIKTVEKLISWINASINYNYEFTKHNLDIITPDGVITAFDINKTREALKDKSIFFKETTYEGNTCFIFIPQTDSVINAYNNSIVKYYGHHISYQHRDVFNCLIDIREGSPLTPVLPARASIIEDEKFDIFHKEMKRVFMKYILMEYDNGNLVSLLKERVGYNTARLYNLITFINEAIAGKDVLYTVRPIHRNAYPDKYQFFLGGEDNISNYIYITGGYRRVEDNILKPVQLFELGNYDTDIFPGSIIYNLYSILPEEKTMILDSYPSIPGYSIVVDYSTDGDTSGYMFTAFNIYFYNQRIKIDLVNQAREVDYIYETKDTDGIFLRDEKYRNIFILTASDKTVEYSTLLRFRDDAFQSFEYCVDSDYGDYDIQHDLFITHFQDLIRDEYKLIRYWDIRDLFTRHYDRRDVRKIEVCFHEMKVKIIDKDNQVVDTLTVNNAPGDLNE